MTIFENYKQQYLNYKEAFDYILDPKHEEYLIEYLGESETKILKLVFNTFIEKLNNHQKGEFEPASVLNVETVKQATGLSYYQQKNAIQRLVKYFQIIKYNYAYLYRALEINFENIWKLYRNFVSFKSISVKIKKLNKEQLIKYILKNEERLSYYEEEEEEF